MARSRALLLFVFPLLAALAAGAAEWDDDVVVVDGGAAALADDEQCEQGGDCALSALQLRGKKVAGRAVEETSDQKWGSCGNYGCGNDGYRQWQTCQCNSKCSAYGNCCSDYVAHCVGQAPSPPPYMPAGPGAPAAPGKIYGHPDPNKGYPDHPGFTLTLVEEFDHPIDLDSDPIWTWSDGGLVEGQIRFVKEQLKFEDGKLKIQVAHHPAYTAQTCSHAEVGFIKPKDMVSGEMRTRHNWFRYGRYEARIKAPSVQPGNNWINGNYVSTMFVFRDGKYKHWREIDFEITGDSTHSVTTNVLSADNTDKWKAGIQESKQVHVDFNTRSEFHTYAFEWLPDRITWYIDGKVVREKRGGGVRIPDMSGKIMMNLWMFDDRALFGGPQIKNNRYPMESEYEWFRFYRWNGEKHYPCAGMGTSCLTPDDQYLTSNNPCDHIAQEGTVYGKPPCHASCR